MDQSTSSSSSTSNHRHHHGNGTRVVSHSEQDFARYDLNLNLNLNLNEDNDDEDKVLMAFVQAGSNKEDDLDAFMDAQMNMDDWSEDEREEEAPVELFQMEEGAGQQREVIGAINPPIAIPAAPYSTMQPVDYDDDMMDWAATACGGGASTNHSVSTASSFERYTETLLPFDIICTARGIYHFQATPNHPGNVTLQRMVQSNLVQYGLATKESERDAVVSSILSQVSSVLWNHGTTNGTTSRIIQEQARFVLVGPPLHNTTTISCRPATAQETKEEIEHALRQHFAIIPTSNCVIFGRGAPARDHPGSRALRAFIEPRRAEYRQSTNKKELERLAKDYISNSRGRFLLPFNKSRPADGCIEADEESIAKKISHLYRHRPRGEGANRTNTDEHQQGIPMVHAQPTNSHHAPIVNHFTATLVPKSSLSSSSSSMTTTSLSDTKGEMSGNKPIPGLVVSVVPGQSSVISTIDIEANHSQNTNNAAAASETSNLSSRATKFVANRNKRTVLVCIFILAIAAIVGIIVATTGGDGSVESPRMWYDDANESTLGQILNRGYLRCGIPNQEGYGMKDPVTGVFVGFEVDLCRAVAAGIFGRESFGNRATEPVQYVNLEVSDRFVALDGEEIDLLLAITTQNMQRNVYEPSTLKGYTFSTPYLVNGLIFAGLPEYLECLEGPLDANVTAATSCEEAKICVLDGTTHKDIVLQKLPELAIGSVVTPSTLELFYDHFINGDVCNILAGEQFDLSEEILRKKRYSGPYQVGSQVLSKELISMVTRDDDPEWSDFVNWILQALMSAEELRIFSGSSNDVSPSELETTLAFGKRFEFMFQDAFFVVGDYGQIYAKHLESLVPRSDANQINLGGETPGMYAIQVSLNIMFIDNNSLTVDVKDTHFISFHCSSPFCFSSAPWKPTSLHALRKVPNSRRSKSAVS
jgi:general L-amino acid transport system substrate-binding protein